MEARPPDETTHGARQTAQAQGAAEGGDRLEWLFLVAAQASVDVGQSAFLRLANAGEEDDVLIAHPTFDGNASHGVGVLVEARSQERHVHAPQLRTVGSDKGERFHEERRPTRPRRGPLTGENKRSQMKAALHRGGRHLPRNVRQVTQ
jgi:hypothetical protein